MMNAVRTSFLLAAMTGLFMAIGFLVGGTGGMVLALMVSVATNALAFWNADKIVLRLQNAVPLDQRRAPEIYEMVAGLCQRAGLPMPALYLIETDQPNAFATGRDPNHAAVAISAGLVQALDRRELAGVIAHELAHIRSRDTLTMTLTATLAGAISMLAQFGLFFGGRNANSSVGPIAGFAMIILAPVAAMLVQMAVSRTREYEADRDGAEISGDPLALASALEKISQLAQRRENSNARRVPGMAHMFIVNPLRGRGADNLFATHPAVENRIAALAALATKMGRPDPVMAQSLARPGADAYDRRRDPSWRVPSAGPKNKGLPPRGPWG